LDIEMIVTEAGDTTPVKSGPGKFAITILKSGQGSSGYYPADVMERDGAKAFPKGTHVHLDHPTETAKYDHPERSVKDLVGSLSEDASYDKASKSLIGKMEIMPQYKDLVAALAPHVGMSIRAKAYAESAEVDGAMVHKVTHLVHGESVDIVTHAGAGGHIMSMIESAKSFTPATPPVPVGTPKKENNMELTKEDFTAIMAESNKALLSGLVESLKPAPVGGDPIDAVLGLATALSESGLNPAAQKLVVEAVRHGAKPTEAIEAHKAAFSVAAPVVTQVARPAQDAYGQLVQQAESRIGLGYGELSPVLEANKGGNVPAPIGGAVIGQGHAEAAELSESERADWEKVITSLVEGKRAF
jgi:hypothetical protein